MATDVEEQEECDEFEDYRVSLFLLYVTRTLKTWQTQSPKIFAQATVKGSQGLCITLLNYSLISYSLKFEITLKLISKFNFAGSRITAADKFTTSMDSQF